MQRLSRAGIDPATAVDYTREGLSVDDTILAIELGLQPTDLREGASNRPAEPEAIQEERRLRRYNQYLDDIQAGLREGFEILNIHPADQETVAPPGYSYVTCEVRHPDNGQIITAQIRADHDQYGTSRASQEHLARRVLAGGATVESVANPSLLTRHPHPDFYEYAEARIVNDGQMGAWVMFEFERRHWHA